jgi:hypothetical protein
VELVGTAATNGQIVTIPVQLVAVGTENALGFNVAFSPSQLSYLGISRGTNAGTTVINLNTNQSSVGLLGMAMALSAGNTFPAGTNQLALLSFLVQNSGSWSLPVTFTATNPIVQQVCDKAANVLTASYASAVILNQSAQQVPPPRVGIQISNGTVNLVWPQDYSNYMLQSAGSLGFGLWNSNLGQPTVSGSNYQLILPATNAQQFYRLSH